MPEGPPAGPIRWRPPALLLLAAGVVLSALAVATRDPVPLFLALPLLIALLAAVIELGAEPGEIHLRWAVSGDGPDVRIDGDVGGAPDPVPRLSLDLERPGLLDETRPPSLTREGERWRIRLEWRAPYPCLEGVPVPRAVARDRLGLAERDLSVVADPLRVERFPPELARIGSIHLRRTTPVPGEVRSRSIGRSGEFFSLRPVGPGDTRREVNWGASARAGRLLANDYLADRTGDLVIVLDARATSLGPKRDGQLLAISRAAAHGIALSFLREKARVGVAVYGEFLSTVPLGSGRAHRSRIERFLDAARVDPVPGTDERLAVSLRRYFPQGVSTLLVSPFADEESIEVLAHLRRRGFVPVVLSPSPLPLLLPGTETSEESRLARRLMLLVRRQRLNRAWQEAPVLDWEEYWSLGGLRDLFAGPSSGGRR